MRHTHAHAHMHVERKAMRIWTKERKKSRSVYAVIVDQEGKERRRKKAFVEMMKKNIKNACFYRRVHEYTDNRY